MARINLLPWREELRKERQQQFLLGIGLAAAIGAIIVGGWWTYMNTLIDYQKTRNQRIQREISRFDAKIREIEELKTLKEQLLARMEVIENLQGDRGMAVEFFNTIVTTLPEGVYLTSVKQQDKRLEIAGVAESNGRISALLRTLNESEWVSSPALEVINTQQSGDVRISTFQLVARFGRNDEEGDEE